MYLFALWLFYRPLELLEVLDKTRFENSLSSNIEHADMVEARGVTKALTFLEGYHGSYILLYITNLYHA